MTSVVCPKCRGTLRSAVDLAGKSVRCQNCKEKFRVPGGPAPATPAATPATPVAKATPAKPVAAAPVAQASADPFAFDDPTPSPASQLSTIELPSEPAPALPASSASGDPFAFGNPDGAVVSVPGQSKPGGARRSKAALADKDDKAEKPARRGAKAKTGGAPVGLIVGWLAALVLVLGGGGFAAYWFLFRTPEVAQTTTPPTTSTTAGKASPAESVVAVAASADGRRVKDEKVDRAVGSDKEKTGDAKRGAPQAPPSLLPGGNPPAKPAANAAYTLTPPAADAKVVAPPKQAASLAVPFATVRQVKFAGANPPFAFVLRVKEPGFQGLGVKESVERFALNGVAAGEAVVEADKVVGSKEAPGTRVFDVSADGTKAAVEGPAGKLTVYDFEAKAKAWDAEAVGGPGRTGLVAVAFLTPNALAVVDRSGAVDVWDVAGKKLAGMPGVRPQSAGDMALPVAAGRAGPRVGVAIGAKVYAFDGPSAADAKPLFELPAGSAAPLAVTADPADKRLAVAAGGGKADPKCALVLGPRQAGGTPDVIPLPDVLGTPTGVAWPSDAAVVVTFDKGAGAAVIDAEAATPLAYLKADKAVQVAGGQSGRHWYAAADEKDAAKTALVAAEVPFEPSSGVAAEASAGKKPVYLLPRTDGLAK